MVFKSLHGLAPEYLCSKFERRQNHYNLRDSENKLRFHCHAQTIIKIVLAVVALYSGTVFHEN